MFQSLKKLLSLFEDETKNRFWSILVMMLVVSFLETLSISAIPAFLLVVSDPEKLLKIPFVGSSFKNISKINKQDILVFGSIGLISIYVIKNLFISWYFYLRVKFVFKQQSGLEIRMFKSYMAAPYSFHLRSNSAQLLRNTTGEVGIITKNLMIPYIQFLMDSITVLSILVLLFIAEPVVTLFSFFVLGLGSFLFLRITNSKVKRLGKDSQKLRTKKIKAVSQGIGAFKEARVMNREEYFINELANISKKHAANDRYMQFVNTLPKPFIETISVAGMLLVAIILNYQGRNLQSIIATLTLFAAAAMRIMPSIREMVKAYSSFKYNYHSIEPVYQDLKQLEKFYINKVVPIKRLPLQNVIEIHNLSFSYEKSKTKALSNVSFSIPQGSAVALVGASGAGKSTLADLILGILEPTGGGILADGFNIKNSLPEWQINVGYIPQVIYLSDDSLKRNIALGMRDDEIEKDKLQRALEDAQLSEFVRSLPEGIETVVGERGTRLSGGQRQRIGIARALYHEPAVIVMDEATSALDNLTEKYIIEQLERLKGKITIIMIAHRLSTVKNCDKLFLLKEGRIVGEGTYNELVSSNEEFRKMSLINKPVS